MSYRITVDQIELAAQRDGRPTQYIVSVFPLPTIKAQRAPVSEAIMAIIESEPCRADLPTMDDTEFMFYRQRILDEDYRDAQARQQQAYL